LVKQDIPMKLFLDTADPKEIASLAATGLVDGVTTNPSLAAKTGKSLFESLRAICDVVKGSVSAEVTALETEAMIAEGRKLAKIADNITVKVPLTWDGLKACRTLARDGLKVNVTLCFSPNQALLAAKCGAAFISPFIGRLDDAGHDGMALIREIRHIYDNYGFSTEILAASIRHPTHVRDAALARADVATMPPAIFRQLVYHPLTDKGLAAFLEDWKKTGQTIL
jgi:transaldolase